MTDQTKIPLPENGKGGKSLFERAERSMADGQFQPAPVPRHLAQPVNRRVQKAVPAARPPVAAAAAFPEQATAPVKAAAPAQAAAPVPQDLPPIEFRGQVHAVDRDLLRHNGLIQPDSQVTGLMEEFRIVRRQVLQSMRAAQQARGGARAQRVLVCSPLPEEGKTFCATNLALAMAAEKDGEVILVDADFAKPSILSLLGLPKGPGLMDALANPDITVEDCVIRTDIHGLFVLPAGNQTATDSEYLSSTRTAQVFDRLTQGAPRRIVIFDSPPALAASPAAELANHVGQAVVVARADRTGQSALEDALSLLSACPDIKLLLNAAHFSPSGRRFGDYYGYGG